MLIIWLANEQYHYAPARRYVIVRYGHNAVALTATPCGIKTSKNTNTRPRRRCPARAGFGGGKGGTRSPRIWRVKTFDVNNERRPGVRVTRRSIYSESLGESPRDNTRPVMVKRGHVGATRNVVSCRPINPHPSPEHSLRP